MSADILDLTGTPNHSEHRALINRLSTLLSVNAQQLVLASSPADVYRAFDVVDQKPDEDRSVQGVLGLDRPLDNTRVTLIQLGPDAAPVSVLAFESVERAAAIAAELSVPPLSLLRAGLDALRPAARLKARADREKRDRLLQPVMAQLDAVEGVTAVELTDNGLKLSLKGEGAQTLSRDFALKGQIDGSRLMLTVRDAAGAEALADWLGASDKGRTATIRRTTKETDIALSVDLDGSGGQINTGVHFFDHMLDQIARHGGIGLSVVCEGDVEVDAHHTIEDVCLALGEGLREALGDKRGIARFGFETPMDETRASVWIDLSGRPFARFDGEIPGERVGDFPIEMCEHAFRSLAESLRAAIHVKVDGENAHHMVESCFKSFGRALRMAKRVEGDALPSTKGVL
jgi:imidazoleglycerol phosphate dehydratase HisB